MVKIDTGQEEANGHAPPEPRRIRLAWHLMSYPGSYAAAWKRLLPGTVQLALPTLYLQRHTLELLLKELLLELLAIRELEWAGIEILGLPSISPRIDPRDSRAHAATHDLGRLSSIVSSNLACLGLPLLPAAFEEVLALLDEVEEGSPERLRYATIWDKGTRQLVPSFNVPRGDDEGKTAAIDRIGELLTEILSWASAFPLEVLPDNPGRAATMRFFYDSLSDGRDRVAHHISNALDRLESATRSGEVKWTSASQAAEATSEADLPHMVACYQSKVIVLVPVGAGASADSSRASGARDVKYFLAAEREDGSLTVGIWLDDCGSNLPRAIWDTLPED